MTPETYALGYVPSNHGNWSETTVSVAIITINHHLIVSSSLVFIFNLSKLILCLTKREGVFAVYDSNLEILPFMRLNVSNTASYYYLSEIRMELIQYYMKFHIAFSRYRANLSV